MTCDIHIYTHEERQRERERERGGEAGGGGEVCVRGEGGVDGRGQ